MERGARQRDNGRKWRIEKRKKEKEKKKKQTGSHSELF